MRRKTFQWVDGYSRGRTREFTFLTCGDCSGRIHTHSLIDSVEQWHFHMQKCKAKFEQAFFQTRIEENNGCILFFGFCLCDEVFQHSSGKALTHSQFRMIKLGFWIMNGLDWRRPSKTFWLCLGKVPNFSLVSKIEMKFEMGFVDKKYFCCTAGKDLDHGITK